MIGVYQIINTINGKQYIGSSINISIRKYRHFYLLRKGKHTNGHLQSAFDKYSEQSFLFEILLECPEENLITEEQRFIDEAVAENGWDSLYNICSKADGSKHSEETLKRMSISMIGKNKGKVRSEETKRKQSESHRGLFVGENNPMYGRTGEKSPRSGTHHSEEARKEISKNRRGKCLGEDNPSYGRHDFRGENSPVAKLTFSQAENIRILAKENISQTELAKIFGVSRQTINRIVKNKSYVPLIIESD